MGDREVEWPVVTEKKMRDEKVAKKHRFRNSDNSLPPLFHQGDCPYRVVIRAGTGRRRVRRGAIGMFADILYKKNYNKNILLSEIEIPIELTWSENFFYKLQKITQKRV